ncbi:Predicted dehydrogenase [Devosia enhydra]|uniref:Predicted dehydrogenase n=1 Tax=Devosia enhydra TaxID=665118 RepID=A0A1K2HXD9_9HYPH|nr:Gfo/Idh/MocA family oxidoreductase [Devosia enhydra]SFZ83565.1 Predicted dehydrogenase [Devosia enhydra]
MTRRRIGILGFAHYHANFWTRAFKAAPDIALMGFWEAYDGLADAARAEHGIDRWTERDGLIAACDGLAICSATADHEGLIAAVARRRGKWVLCEKPLATSVEAGARIAALAEDAGLTVMQSFPKRFDPINAEIRAVLASGALGRITLVRVRHGHSHGLDPSFGAQWFCDPALSGGGTLIDEGIHAADFLRWCFGEPESVSATIASPLRLRVEDSAVASFVYANGMIAEVATSWSFAAADHSIEIYGTGGTLLLSGVDIASRPTRETGFLSIFEREGPRKGWRTSPTVPGFKTGLFHEQVASAFVKALVTGAPVPVTIADGRRAFAMIDAAYRSARSGRREAIDYEG